MQFADTFYSRDKGIVRILDSHINNHKKTSIKIFHSKFTTAMLKNQLSFQFPPQKNQNFYLGEPLHFISGRALRTSATASFLRFSSERHRRCYNPSRILPYNAKIFFIFITLSFPNIRITNLFILVLNDFSNLKQCFFMLFSSPSFL